MPRRTNGFQELVSLVQKALVPAGAVVTDSPLVDVPGMGEPREIDVLIEQSIGPYRMKIAVEAKDHRRKMDSTQFEAIVGKYFGDGRVKVNKVVIVTHNGFYTPVIERAKQLDITLLTLREAKKIDWQWFRPLPGIFRNVPRVCDIQILPAISGDFLEAALGRGTVACSHGAKFGTPFQFAAFVLMNHVMKSQREAIDAIDAEASVNPDGKKAKVEFRPDHPHWIELEDKRFPIEKLSFVVHFSKANDAAQLRNVGFKFHFAPHVCQIEPEPPIKNCLNKELQTEGRLVCTCCGKDHGTLLKWANDVAFKHFFPRYPDVAKRFLEELSRSKDGQFRMTITAPLEQRLLRFRGADYPLTSLSVTIHAISASGPMGCQQYELAGDDGMKKLVSHFEATAGGRVFNIVIPHGENGPAERIAVRMDSAEIGVKTPTLESARQTSETGG